MQKVRGGNKAAIPGQAISNELYAADDLGLSFYEHPPNAEVSVRDFEEFTRDRLKVLHTFDRLCGFDTVLDKIPELRPRVAKELSDARLLLGYPMMTNVNFLEQKVEFVRRDAISHFALRLAFCKTRDAREWFVRQEQRLFVLRFEDLKPEAKEAYLAASGVRCRKYEPKSDSRFSIRDLQVATPGAKIWNSGKVGDFDPNFYEMPFFEVPSSLLSSRRVVLHGGNAYVPASALKLILAKKFKDRLHSFMDIAFQGLPTALSDPRIGGFLRDLQEYGMQLLVAPKSSADDPGDKLSLDNFEEYLVRSFPPCMRRMVEKQRETKKHLKHLGRLQLRPFLKECGFTIDESFKWWKNELTKDPEIDATSYDKNYTYDIDHAYGKKGHLQGQNCFGCPKIIGFANESPGQVHGCPFRHLDMPALKQQLHRWRVPESAMLEIEKLINNGKHFQLACIEYFKGQHPGHEGEGVGNSPNDFFRESCRHHLKKKEKDGKANGSPEKLKAITSPAKEGATA
uniref:DNA primase large subunit C-terminal domain-containing protein n=1 Tax=Alexandrium monilatum TaxID=311494 RepID=A0A7S4Q686_9DINO